MEQVAHRLFIVGDSETWKYSLTSNLWGFSEHFKGYWNTSNPGDYLAFYVTSPIKKIIVFGRIKRMFIDKRILFPDEIFLGRPIWIYRYQYKTTITIEEWNDGISPPQVMLNVGRKLIDHTTFNVLIKKAERKWKMKITDNV